MAYDEIIKRAINTQKTYEELPSRIQAVLSQSDWRARVKETCTQQGQPWAGSLAATVCGEQEYYEDMLKSYKAWMRLYPYHLAHYVCRVLRVPPFKYYLDMLVACLVVERPYHQLPNFTAADIVRVVGVGRNEYIATLNACKGRRLLWRVNRASVARDALPSEPQPYAMVDASQAGASDGGGHTRLQRLEPWWCVSVVNIGEAEYRELSPEEIAHLKTAAAPPLFGGAGGDGPDGGDEDEDVATAHMCRVGDLQQGVLVGLLRKGLVYLEVPVRPSDRFSIPPLEGFVSNRDAGTGPAGDPTETALYAVLLANSERLTVAELASILGSPMRDVAAALGVACRLGFATRIHPGVMASAAPSGGLSEELSGTLGLETGEASWADAGAGMAAAAALAAAAAEALSEEDEDEGLGPMAPNRVSLTGNTGMRRSSSGMGRRSNNGTGNLLVAALMANRRMSRSGRASGSGTVLGEAKGENEGALGVVLDAEATSFLMMGALSPGLKRHAVTLFEGGRVAGEATVGEMVGELWASFAQGQAFEGDMARLTQFAGALASVLDVAREAVGREGGVVGVELLRKESLAGLAPSAAAKVLSAAYCALLPVTPLPHPPLPIIPDRPGMPAYWGAAGRAAPSPWLPLALYTHSQCGPVTLVLAAGQRLWRLPAVLERATHVLLWPWDDLGASSDRPRALAGALGSGHGSAGPLLVEAPFLLATLNEVLALTALMVQPLCAAPLVVAHGARGGSSGAHHHSHRGSGGGTRGDGAGVGSMEVGGSSAGAVLVAEVQDAVAGGGAGTGVVYAGGGAWDAAVVDVPLPLPAGLLKSWGLEKLLAQGAALQQAQADAAVSPTHSAAAQQPGGGPFGTATAQAGGGGDLNGSWGVQGAASKAHTAEGAAGTSTHTNNGGGASTTEAAFHVLHGLDRKTNVMVDVAVPSSVVSALLKLGLGTGLGVLRLAHLPGTRSPTAAACMAGASEGGEHEARAAAAAIAELPSRSSWGANARGDGSGMAHAAAGAGGDNSSTGAGQGTAGHSGTAAGSTVAAAPTAGWVPLSVSLGVPLYCLPLCRAVCLRAREAGSLSAAGREAQRLAQIHMGRELDLMVNQYSCGAQHSASYYHAVGPSSQQAGHPDAPLPPLPHTATGQNQQTNQQQQQQQFDNSFAAVQLPSCNLLFDGSHLMPVDLSACLQGSPVFLS